MRFFLFILKLNACCHSAFTKSVTNKWKKERKEKRINNTNENNDIIIEMKRVKERKKEESLQVPSVISEEGTLLVITSCKGREGKERTVYSSRHHRQQEDGTP